MPPRAQLQLALVPYCCDFEDVVLHFVLNMALCSVMMSNASLLVQGKLDAVAAAMLLTAYFERPEGAMKVKSIKHR